MRERDREGRRGEWDGGGQIHYFAFPPSCLSWALQAAAGIVDQSALLL